MPAERILLPAPYRGQRFSLPDHGCGGAVPAADSGLHTLGTAVAREIAAPRSGGLTFPCGGGGHRKVKPSHGSNPDADYNCVARPRLTEMIGACVMIALLIAAAVLDLPSWVAEACR